MPTTAASIVIRFDQANSEAAVKPNHAIRVTPSPVRVGDAVTVDIFAPAEFSLLSAYGWLGQRHLGVAPEHVAETLDIDPATDNLSTKLPVDSGLQARAVTPIVYHELVIYPSGDTLHKEFISAKAGFLAKHRQGGGTAAIEYDTHIAQTWTHAPFEFPGLYILWAVSEMLSEPEAIQIKVEEAVVEKPAAKTPHYRIVTEPGSPKIDEPVKVSIYAFAEFSLFSPYGGLGAKNAEPAIEVEEIVGIQADSDSLNTSYPVAEILSIVTHTPWVSGHDILLPAGDPGIAALLALEDGWVTRAKGPDGKPVAGDGSVRIKYRTPEPQVWTHAGFPDAGLYDLSAESAILEKPEHVYITVTEAESTATARVAFNYAISTVPNPAPVLSPVTIFVFAPGDFDLVSPYDGLSIRRIEPAQEFFEIVNLEAGTDKLPTKYPVDEILFATTQTPWVLGPDLLLPAGDPVIESNLVVENGWAVRAKDSKGKPLAGSGSIRIQYRTYQAQVWTHEGFPDPGLYTLQASSGMLAEPVPVSIIVEGDSIRAGAAVMVTIHAKDFCTDLPIPGAGIYIDGRYVGLSDANGKMVIGLQNPGTHAIKIQASGYLATDGDALDNDSYRL